MNDIILNGIVAVTTAIVSWLLARRKYTAEVDNNIITNMKESLEFYRVLSDDNKKRLDDSQKKLDEVIKENGDLKSELAALKAQIGMLMRFNCMRAGCSKRITNSDEINREEF